VLTEGVIPYLSEQQVAELAVDLHARDNFKFWIAEYFAKACYPYIRNSEMRRKMKNALFQFFPEDWLGFFKTQGWTPREITYLGEAGEKLNRNFPSPWWAAIFTLIMSKQRALEIKRYTGYVIFARADEQAARSR
jgi:O-methyltransferase involved in polyketide biosynthesis